MQRVTWLLIGLAGLMALECHHSLPDPVLTPGSSIQVDTFFSAYRRLAVSPYRQRTSMFLTTWGLTFDRSDNLYFSDVSGNRIGQVTPDGKLSSFAGTGLLGDGDGPLANATFFNPTDLTFDPSGRLTIATTYAIRQVQPDGAVKRILGTGGAGNSTLLTGYYNIAFDQTGTLFAVAWNFSDTASPIDRGPRVLKITPDHQVTTLVRAYKDSTLHTKWFEDPRSLAVDSKGNLYIEAGFYGILRVTPQGEVTTFVGTAAHPSPTSSAPMNVEAVSGLVIDQADNLLFCSSPYLYRATPNGKVSVLGGKPDGFYAGRGDQVSFGTIEGMALDSKGNLYLTDSFYNTIYRVKFNQ